MIYTQKKVYDHNLHFSLDEIPPRVEPRKVLMASPEYFDIIDIKNPHMEKGLGNMDKELAIGQWESVRNEYVRLAELGILDSVNVISGVPGCEDMVFAANQTFPWRDESGKKEVILSKMRHCSRQKEVPYFEEFFRDEGYKINKLVKTTLFEGMGDLIPHYGKMLLYGGYGFRSEKNAYDEIAQLLNVPIIALELINENFYHLDTCFLPIDEETVLICAEAFTTEGLKTIKKMFREVIAIPVHEAAQNFSLNAHIINDQVTGKKVALMQKGGIITFHHLVKKGFEVIEVDTSEFIKSGGSVFCMKMMVY